MSVKIRSSQCEINLFVLSENKKKCVKILSPEDWHAELRCDLSYIVTL